MSSTSRKLESHSQGNRLQDTALSSMRNLLAERERKRGKPFFDSDPVEGQTAAMLVHSLERCLQDVEHDLNLRTYRVNEVGVEGLNLA